MPSYSASQVQELATPQHKSIGTVEVVALVWATGVSMATRTRKKSLCGTRRRQEAPAACQASGPLQRRPPALAIDCGELAMVVTPEDVGSMGWR